MKEYIELVAEGKDLTEEQVLLAASIEEQRREAFLMNKKNQLESKVFISAQSFL